MTSSDVGSSDGIFDFDLPLSAEESLDDDELDVDPEEGYSPPERPLGVLAWGVTAFEAGTHEDLAHRLAREEPEVGDDEYGDGIGDAFDTDGEPIDDQVGDARAGRLVLSGLDVTDPRSDFQAHDVGIDGAGASAEEAAVHIVPDDAGDA